MYWNYGSLYELHICNMAVKVFILTFSLKRTTSAVHVCIFFNHQNAEREREEREDREREGGGRNIRPIPM